MFRKLCGLLILAAAVPVEAHAANFAVITAPPTFLSILVFLAAGAGAVVCSQVWSSVKGGNLGRVWQMFMIGLVLLVINRAIALLQDFQIAVLPEFLAPAILVLMVGAIVYGMFEAKRLLG